VERIEMKVKGSRKVKGAGIGRGRFLKRSGCNKVDDDDDDRGRENFRGYKKY